MNSNEDKPTKKFYGLFQYIFDHFNDRLFDGSLKDVVITVTRQKNVFGHFIFKNWFVIDNDPEGDRTIGTDEIALNPSMFMRFPLIEICQTIVHEMCHAWQAHYGSPSRPGYHNREWADKMKAIGLMPSDTGAVGGKVVGQKMNDYPIIDGAFLSASEELLTGEVFTGLYLEANPALEALLSDGAMPTSFDEIKNFIISLPPPVSKPQTRVKYRCDCSSVWGKTGLLLKCEDCGSRFSENNT